ncbi:hypothetical protein QT979_08880 [Microcoleus sp. w2-18bC1]|uniref:hypothetical protein n=1 Tax=unclassified Microcoleus TaxID=2642155 RepID=UPI002FD25AB4
MFQKHKTNNSVPSALDFVAAQALVVELGEENEKLLSGGYTGEDRIRPQLTARDVEQVTGTGSLASHYGIRSIPTLMIGTGLTHAESKTRFLCQYLSLVMHNFSQKPVFLRKSC